MLSRGDAGQAKDHIEKRCVGGTWFGPHGTPTYLDLDRVHVLFVFPDLDLQGHMRGPTRVFTGVDSSHLRKIHYSFQVLVLLLRSF